SLQKKDEDETKRVVKKEKITTKQNKTEKVKFSFNEQREYNEIDDIIANLEEQIEKTTEELNNSMSDYIKLQELTDKKEQLEKQLEEKMDRWIYLNDIAEKMANK
ncbi:MAG: ABC transporter C-terminal domain-containing protein, partial [Oscillospiraceae bacterium]